MYAWQKELIKGFKPGEMAVMMSGRQTGKSQIQAYMRMWNDIHGNVPIEDLKLTVGTVYGKRYHCVEPVGGNWLEMEKWAIKTFGESGSIWDHRHPADHQTPMPNARWYMNNRKFWFLNEQDQMMFVMKWR